MRFRRCRHRRLSYPVGKQRECLDCFAVLPFENFTLTEADKQMAAAITHNYDPSGLRNTKQPAVVRSITRKQVKP